MKTSFIILRICCLVLLAGKSPHLVAQKKFGNRSERAGIAREMELAMRMNLLDKWYPHNRDTVYGGFLSTYTYNFQASGVQDKMIVTQARHVWSNAVAAKIYPGSKYFRDCAAAGFAFLRDKMWDSVYGGFVTLVDRSGKLKDSTGKITYGNAFGIYACAAWYATSGDTGALSLAKKCFNWLETHCYDPVYKGYYQDLAMDGVPMKRNNQTPSASTVGYKDQNTSIHLLEAFTELYHVWPDPLLHERLKDMFYLVRDVITSPKGSLVLFLQPDWTPVSFRDSSKEVILRHRYIDHVSFGHDVETAYLLLEAAETLGMKNDRTTVLKSKEMVDHALQNGWDNSKGGFYDEGYYFRDRDYITIIKNSKNWWAQAEGLNSLLLMADLFPNDSMNYYAHFKMMWKYIQDFLIDHRYGDWYEEGLDTRPERRNSLKGHIWKGTYHHLRALSNCINRLRGTDH